MSPRTILAVTFEGVASGVAPLTETENNDLEFSALSLVLSQVQNATIFDVTSLELQGTVIDREHKRRSRRRDVNGFIMTVGFNADVVSIAAASLAAQAVTKQPLKLCFGTVSISSISAAATIIDDSMGLPHRIFSTILFWSLACFGTLLLFYAASVALGSYYYGAIATFSCAIYAVFCVESDEADALQTELEAEEFWEELDSRQKDRWTAVKKFMSGRGSKTAQEQDAERQRDADEARANADLVAQRNARLERSLRERIAKLEQVLHAAEASDDEAEPSNPQDEQASAERGDDRGGNVQAFAECDDDHRSAEPTLRRRPAAAAAASAASPG